MSKIIRPSINVSRSFAKLMGLEVRGRGPFYIQTIDSCDPDSEIFNQVLSYNLSAGQVADYLEAHDVAQLQASGPCCLARLPIK